MNLAKNNKNCYINDSNGFIALISILIVGAVGTSIVVSLVFLGIGSSKTALVVEMSNRALVFAENCAEEALLVIRDNNSFVGNESISFTGGSCSYNIENIGGEQRNIVVEGLAESVTRKVEIVVQEIKPKIIIISWEEI